MRVGRVRDKNRRLSRKSLLKKIQDLVADRDDLRVALDESRRINEYLQERWDREKSHREMAEANTLVAEQEAIDLRSQLSREQYAHRKSIQEWRSHYAALKLSRDTLKYESENMLLPERNRLRARVRELETLLGEEETPCV